MGEPIHGTLFFGDTPPLDAGPELLPPGKFTFEVKAAKAKVAGTGAQQIMLTSEIVTEGPHKGKKGWDFWRIPSAADIEKHGKDQYILKLWGQVAKLLPEVVRPTGIEDVDGLVGLRYTATISHETYQDKPRNKFGFPFPVSVGEVAPADAGPAVFSDPK